MGSTCNHFQLSKGCNFCNIRYSKKILEQKKMHLGLKFAYKKWQSRGAIWRRSIFFFILVANYLWGVGNLQPSIFKKTKKIWIMLQIAYKFAWIFFRHLGMCEKKCRPKSYRAWAGKKKLRFQSGTSKIQHAQNWQFFPRKADRYGVLSAKNVFPGHFWPRKHLGQIFLTKILA